ncbi:MAG: hypothetical protein N0C84_16885 [Candidatus Thiodiazotropha taylori]|uniref:YubB ferredoxin-like domain-containing protein n=1 Tax=Candidatus Thiodiazotropha taylori TaxID=2792791 RepID=A0A9E4T321_9GAMM|nr:hypothetical protein [Candidatus Thiodiazotropha taylori]MCW4258142.1 hypothetical protein [Candidatus Thiodiazotropha taylori]
MPNHVTNKITFSGDIDLLNKILDEVKGHNGAIDFNSLIPRPLSVYLGNTCMTDDEDFGQHTWLEWNRANWGTKWNAYECKAEVSNGKAELSFDTAWSVPYPFIIAFANKYGLDFTHKYFDEGHNFWGVEEWSDGTRVKRNKSSEDIRRELHLELKGWDYEADEEPA